VLLLPDGDDPDSFARKHTAEEYVDYINQHQVDFIRFKTDLLLRDAGTDVRARATVINNIAESIARIDDTITRSLYITECASLTRVREENIIEAVNSTRNRLKLAKIQENIRDKARNETTQPQEKTTAQEEQKVVRKTQSQLAVAEGNLMKFLILYGEKVIGEYEQKNGTTKPVTFAEYVNAMMTNDDLSFTNPLYNSIMQELLDNLDKPSFTASNYLLSHPNDAIRNYAMAQIADYSTTITIDEKTITAHLDETAYKLVSELTLATIADKITELSHLINSGTLSDEQMTEKTIELATYKQAQIQLKNNKR
jgi:DNA primase